MSTGEEEVAKDLSPIVKIYKDGRVERLLGTDTVPPSLDPVTGVRSSDLLINPSLPARLYVPTRPRPDPARKLPLVLYFHGGGFLIESAASPTYQRHLAGLAAAAPAAVLSVDYRLAPEHPLPAAYHDALAALRWASAASADPDSPLRPADPTRIFLAGDSAGANIAHRVAVESPAAGIAGAVLVHPYFWGSDAGGGETAGFLEALWEAARPGGTEGTDDPWINPEKDPELGRIGCGRVLVCVAEKDFLRDRGVRYGDVLRESGWGGTVEVFETKGENHVFHLFNPTCDNSSELTHKICAFINHHDAADA